ncbi:MAG: membrane protease YdiL (CAAX protease family) [Limisphaerales bacterium]
MNVLVRFWQKIPALIRGPILGILVLLLGVQPLFILVSTNLKVMSTVPWSVIPGVIYLWLFWSYLNGVGPPGSSSDRRRELLRANVLCPDTRTLVVLASLSLALLIASFAVITYAAREVTTEELGMVSVLSESSPFTAVGLIFLVALFSGVVEEAAFRGYMQVSLEQAYHPVVAIAIVSLAFALVHPQALAFIAVFMVGACGWSILAYLCGSIKPLIVVHFTVDFSFLLWMYFFPQAFENLLALNVLVTGLNGTVISWLIIWLLSAVCFITAAVLLTKKRRMQVHG